MRFRAEIQRGGRSATSIPVPAEVAEELALVRYAAVDVTVNGYAYRGTLVPAGDHLEVPLSPERRAAAGVGAGDLVDVDLVAAT